MRKETFLSVCNSLNGSRVRIGQTNYIEANGNLYLVHTRNFSNPNESLVGHINFGTIAALQNDAQNEELNPCVIIHVIDNIKKLPYKHNTFGFDLPLLEQHTSIGPKTRNIIYQISEEQFEVFGRISHFKNLWNPILKE